MFTTSVRWLVAALFLFSAPAARSQPADVFNQARRGDREAVSDFVVSRPAAIDSSDARRCTLLHYAVGYGHADIATFLLDRGASIEAADIDGDRPLHWAAAAGMPELIGLLASRGAEIDSRNSDGNTPLWWAITEQDLASTRALLELGADPKLLLEEGRLSAHDVLEVGDRELADLTLEMGMDWSARNGLGNTALHSAAAGGLAGVVQRLIAEGAQLDARNHYGWTALHLAAASGYRATVNCLLRAGANPTALLNDGRSAYHLAATGGHRSVAEFVRVRNAPADEWTWSITGDYLGQPAPGLSAEIFAPGILSLMDSYEFACTFMPDGSEIYFTRRRTVPDQRIWFTRRQGDGWTEPALAPFSHDCFEYEPHITPDGSTLYYGSQRPLPGESETAPQANIWKVEREGSGWSRPQFVGTDMMFISTERQGTLYYTGRPNPDAGFSICTWPREGDTFGPAVDLGESYPFLRRTAHPCIAPDGSYLIVDGRQLPGSFGDSDLYVTFCEGDGSWSEPINLGGGVNSEGEDIAASLSPDGRYLFYTTFYEGFSDLRWVSAELITQLRGRGVR